MIRKVSTKRLSKLGKTLAVLVLAALLTWSIPQSKASAAAGDPVFSHNGSAYVYSNNPENITSTSGAYTIDKYLTAGSFYDVELYHCASVAGMQIGIAIWNRGSSTATITVSARRIVSGGGMTSATTVETDYQNGVGSTTMTVAANGAQWVLLASNVTQYSYVVGKAKLKSNTANVEMKVVYGPTGAGASIVMAYPQTTLYKQPTSSYSGTTTGYFPHDALATTVSFPTVSSFVLPGWDPALPTSRNEYEAAQTGYACVGPCGPLGGTNVVLGGNYGMVYAITITGASGKTLSISPKSGYSGTIVVQIPSLSSTWYSYTISAGSSHTFSITSASWVINFVQPGGNSSNFNFSIS